MQRGISLAGSQRYTICAFGERLPASPVVAAGEHAAGFHDSIIFIARPPARFAASGNYDAGAVAAMKTWIERTARLTCIRKLTGEMQPAA